MNIIFEKIHENARIPEHSYGGQHESVGLDFRAALVTPWSLVADGVYTCVASTGLKMQLPERYHMRMASRSGLAFQHQILAFPGTIDNSYRGEIKVKLFCYSDTPPPKLEIGDKIAQGVVFQSLDYDIVEGEVSENTERSTKGFGSSG